MASITTVIVADASGTASCIVCLHDIGIGDTQACGQAGEIQASRFLTNTTLEVADGEVVDEGHLGLNPVSKGLVWEAGHIEDDEFVCIDNFANLS